MAIIKCKMCGGDLDISEGLTVAECEYCGTKQTVPNVDDEKKLTLFARANRLRFANEFDKAAGVYESIVADFPEEAEAYWGLVLCHYGIEYVDDPATGKKVPTCHRSSFESVMEDADFEQACENADAVARRQYREEAKQLEELRKGIIEVSGREQPYDIFICYKETDENGERTLDSVLAQDVYDALTEKGYRVFFSRISLEEKLGTEYEPYIFAALNSAKVMLAFGTDYEYYNAVWVKNEWSRFLKLMAKDKSKHLIPCYKGIDAYDMPKEFAKLQAQDMGKVGATQDLLRGIEKLLPRGEAEAAAQPAQSQVIQQVVQGGGPNVDAMLKRGQQALEDRDWKAAGEFFDKALDMDAECAEAFFGKALAAAQCVNGDELVQKRIAVKPGSDEAETLTACKRDAQQIESAVRRYVVPGYLDEQTIRDAFGFDERTYASLTKAWRRRLEAEAEYWKSDRQMSRAVRYAKGELADKLKGMATQIGAALQKALAQSEEADKKTAQQTAARYTEKMRKAKADAQTQHAAAIEKRQADYESLCAEQTELQKPEELQNIAAKFESEGMKGFADCAERAEQCRSEAEKILARETVRAKQEVAAKAAKKKRTTVIAIAAIVAVVAITLLVTKVIIPGNKYKAAEELLAAEQYDEAADAFAALGAYKDSTERVMQTIYSKAEALLAAGDYDGAIAGFNASAGYKDSTGRAAAIIKERLKHASVGGTVLFGTYEQDNYAANGKEEIEWTVLAKENDRLLVVSKYALDCLEYDKTHTIVTWTNSSLRRWLNRAFLDAAFSEGEKAVIPTVTVNADKNPDYKTDPGSNTEDRIFLLSIPEVERYFGSDNARKCEGTAYCYAQGVHKNYDGFCEWWLRSPGKYCNSAAFVYEDGSAREGSYGASSREAIRPALWIDLGD